MKFVLTNHVDQYLADLGANRKLYLIADYLVSASDEVMAKEFVFLHTGLSLALKRKFADHELIRTSTGCAIASVLVRKEGVVARRIPYIGYRLY